MTLYDLFSPLVSYIVACRHDAACGKAPEEEVLKSHLMREYARIRKTGAAAPELQAGLEDACRYTAFYIDYMVHEGNFPYAQSWQDLGRSRYNELAGDEKFFDYMRGWLEEDTPLARAHLRLMYEMVASGFSGALERRSVRLEELMRRTAEQLALMPEGEAVQALLRQKTDTERRTVRPRHPVLIGLCVTGLGALALVLAATNYLRTYRNTTDDLHTILERTREDIENQAMRHALNSDTLVASRAPRKSAAAPASLLSGTRENTRENSESAAPAAAPAAAGTAPVPAPATDRMANEAASAIAPVAPIPDAPTPTNPADPTPAAPEPAAPAPQTDPAPLADPAPAAPTTSTEPS